MALKNRGVLGDSPPPFANKMIHTTLHYCKHGDDMMLLFHCKHRWFQNSGGVGGGAAPARFANKVIRTTFL